MERQKYEWSWNLKTISQTRLNIKFLNDQIKIVKRAEYRVCKHTDFKAAGWLWPLWI